MAKFRLLIEITLLCGVFSMSTGYLYHFMEDYCPNGVGSGAVDLTQFPEGHGRLRLTRGYGYRRNMDCTLTIRARPGLGMNMRINWLEIYQPLLGCSTDRLIVYAGGQQLVAVHGECPGDVTYDIKVFFMKGRADDLTAKAILLRHELL